MDGLNAELETIYEALNAGDYRRVGEAMSEWHPAILGELLKAVAIAKTIRYPAPHGDYNEGLQKAADAAGRIGERS